jgi:hypothetical protein
MAWHGRWHGKLVFCSSALLLLFRKGNEIPSLILNGRGSIPDECALFLLLLQWNWKTERERERDVHTAIIYLIGAVVRILRA